MVVIVKIKRMVMAMVVYCIQVMNMVMRSMVMVMKMVIMMVAMIIII